MSSQLHAELIRARHLELGMARRRHHRELSATSGRGPRVLPSRVRRGVVSIAACLCLALAVAAMAVAATQTAHGRMTRARAEPGHTVNGRLDDLVRVSGDHFPQTVGALRARGYVEAACMVRGMLMLNPRTELYETITY